MPRKKRSRFRHIVLHHLFEVKGGLSLAALCMVAFTVTQLLAPWPLKIVFDQILLDKPLSPSLSFLQGVLDRGEIVSLAAVALAIVLIALLKGVFSYSQLYITSRIGYQLMYALRRELFSHLQQLSLSFHNRARSGELLTKITSDTGTLKNVFAEWALASAGDLLTLCGMFAVMALLDWKLSLIPLLTFPILFLTLLHLYRKTKASAKKQRSREGKIASRISEILAAVALVQAYGRERYEEERLETENAVTLEESIRTARMEATATRAVEIISSLGTAGVVLFGARQVLRGAMTPGELLVFVGYLSSMYRPVRSLAKLSTKLSKAAVSAERIGALLETEPEIRDDPDAVEASGLEGRIAFENVSFGYGDGSEVLKGVSFAVSPGQRVALVGPSGAGKSTIISLILRLYDATGGSISVDGVDVKRYRRETLRREIGIVLQDSVLFGASVKENIAYGRPDASMAEIVAAAWAANAHEFIVKLENGYDTVLGERGDTLSGGQRQRIAIARALVRDAPILLLDEPMTGLDAESEAKVREALRRLMAGRTCLVITHDLQAAAGADLVLILEDGRIVEQGRHDELMARSLRYRRLNELKTRDEDDRVSARTWWWRALERGGRRETTYRR